MKRHYFAPILCVENLVFTGLMTNGIYGENPAGDHQEETQQSPIRKLYV